MWAKLRRRGWTVASYAASGLLTPLLNPLVSLLVVRVASIELWGSFVSLLVVAQLGAHVVGWGNRDHLLREFSLTPNRLTILWQSSLLTRLVLLFTAFAAVLALGGYSVTRWIGLTILCLSFVLDQAFDVWVVYRRAALWAFGVELLGTLALAGGIVSLGRAITLDQLLVLFSFANLLKTLALGTRFRANMWPLSGQVEWALLRHGWPFFLLGFSGLLQSRIDTYAIAYFLDPHDLGHYQVWNNLWTYLQVLAGLLLTPFVKTLYRFSPRALWRIALQLGLAGVGLTLVAAPLIQTLLTYWYHLPTPPHWMLFGVLFAWPIYAYLPLLYGFLKQDRLGVIILTNLLLALGMWLGLITLLPRWGAEGALWLIAGAQWAQLISYALLSWRHPHQNLTNLTDL